MVSSPGKDSPNSAPSDARAMPRVLVVGPRVPPPTGQSIALEVLLDGIERYGKVDTIDLAERFGRRDRSFSGRRAFAILRRVPMVWRRLRRAQAVYLQIAQSRWGMMRDWLFITLARMSGRAVVAHLHGGGYSDFYESEPDLVRRLIRNSLNHVDRMIVLSDALRKNFAFMGKDFDARIRVVPNPCSVAVRQPKAAPQGEVRLLYMSNLLVEKGYLDCVDAMVHVKRLLPDRTVKLTLAGASLLGADQYLDPSDLEFALNRHIRFLGLEDVVTVVGIAMGEMRETLLTESHIALLPTYYRNEGQPLAIIEAMASGLPFVATAWRGIQDLADKDVGLIVPPRSPIEIAEAIAQLVQDPATYERMSRNDVATATQFSRELHIERMIEVFKEVAEPGSTGSTP